MIKLPFLSPSMVAIESLTPPILDPTIAPYQPILCCWLIEIALMLRWEDVGQQQIDLLDCSDFLYVTGIDEGVGDEFVEKSKTIRGARQKTRRLLQKRLARMSDHELPEDLPLFNNIALLGDLLHLSDADKAILVFVTAMSAFSAFNIAITCGGPSQVTAAEFCRILGRITGLPAKQLERSIAKDGLLVESGLIGVEPGIQSIDAKLDLIAGLNEVLLTAHDDVGEIIHYFIRRVEPGTLTLANYPHLQHDAYLLQDYLSAAISTGVTGANIFLYGPPGVGKTEFAGALAIAIDAELYEVAVNHNDGSPLKGQSRLRAYHFCQNLLAHKDNSLLLFDEVEDVFGGGEDALFESLFGDRGTRRADTGKASVNRTLEMNRTPAVWIANRVQQIDPAFRRRFDYSIRFPVPPKAVRCDIIKHHLAQFQPTDAWIDALADDEQLMPAQFERAAKVAAISGQDSTTARKTVERVLDQSSRLLGQRNLPRRPRSATGFDLRYLNTTLDVSPLIEGLRKTSSGTFCFYGPPGTGKTQLAHYIADAVGVTPLVRRASDLISPYVGETEMNIASMFSAAREQGAALILDEADSFMGDRRSATHSWETTQVNEFLTQMESFEGIFICTTNLLDRLDQASLRRFMFKVRFDYLTPAQSADLFEESVCQLGWTTGLDECRDRVTALSGLTPGDFAVVARQQSLLVSKKSDAKVFFNSLKEELAVKNMGGRPMGFAANL